MRGEQSQGSARPVSDPYARIVAEIRDGRLQPGDRLVETELAARFGVSRTPVREAIQRLEADGMVAHGPRAGLIVRQLDYAEITELYAMRTVLEGTAARFAARAISEIELAELDTINGEMSAAPDVRAASGANAQFHAVILNAARNRYLVRAVEAVQKTLLILGPSTMAEGGRTAEAAAEHAAIVGALRDRDETGAESLMRTHIEAAHRVRLRQFRQQVTE